MFRLWSGAQGQAGLTASATSRPYSPQSVRKTVEGPRAALLESQAVTVRLSFTHTSGHRAKRQWGFRRENIPSRLRESSRKPAPPFLRSAPRSRFGEDRQNQSKRQARFGDQHPRTLVVIRLDFQKI